MEFHVHNSALSILGGSAVDPVWSETGTILGGVLRDEFLSVNDFNPTLPKAATGPSAPSAIE